MDDPTDDFRRHFESLSDEGLLAIHREDLGADQDHRLVTVAIFLWADEAKLAEGLLRSESMPCFLPDENMLRMHWDWTNLLGGLRLVVPAAYAEQAKDLLRSRVSEQDLAAQAESASSEDRLR